MRANGFGPLLAQPGRLRTSAEFLPVFIPSLTAMIGYRATLSLNMPDFTRFGRSQREQIIGQVVALPTTMSLFAAMAARQLGWPGLDCRRAHRRLLDHPGGGGGGEAAVRLRLVRWFFRGWVDPCRVGVG